MMGFAHEEEQRSFSDDAVLVSILLFSFLLNLSEKSQAIDNSET